MTLPLEFHVAGKPSSVNGTSAKKAAWKAAVNAAVSASLTAQTPPWTGVPHSADVTVKIFFFPVSLQYIDVDNGLKHTIDGFCPPLLQNDKSVMRVIAERFPPVPGTAIVVPIGAAAVLLEAMQTASGTHVSGAAPQHATAVKVELYYFNSWGLW